MKGILICCNCIDSNICIIYGLHLFIKKQPTNQTNKQTKTVIESHSTCRMCFGCIGMTEGWKHSLMQTKVAGLIPYNGGATHTFLILILSTSILFTTMFPHLLTYFLHTHCVLSPTRRSKNSICDISRSKTAIHHHLE